MAKEDESKYKKEVRIEEESRNEAGMKKEKNMGRGNENREKRKVEERPS